MVPPSVSELRTNQQMAILPFLPSAACPLRNIDLRIDHGMTHTDITHAGCFLQGGRLGPRCNTTNGLTLFIHDIVHSCNLFEIVIPIPLHIKIPVTMVSPVPVI